jgi:hypothetical protein
MNMSDIDRLLDSTQYKAPENFTEHVMMRIQAGESPSKQAAANRYYRAGLSLIAASLIALFLNLTPWMDHFIHDTGGKLRSFGQIMDYNRTASTIEYFTLKADSILYKPLRILTNQLNKEDSSYE